MASREPTSLYWEEDGQTFHLTLDCYTGISAAMGADITEHPIESGGTISDHSFARNPKFTLQGIVSQTPCVVPFDFNEGMQGFTQEVEVRGAQKVVADYVNAVPPQVALLPGAEFANIPIAGKFVTQIPAGYYTGVAYLPDVSQLKRPKIIVEAIERWITNGILLELRTSLVRKPNLLLEDFSWNYLGGRTELTLLLNQVQIGSSITVELPAVPTKPKAAGPRPNKKPPVEEPAQGESVLFKIFG